MNENNKVYIVQDGTLKSDDIIAELKKYGGDDYYNNTADGKGVYFINTNHYNMIGWKDLKYVGELNAQGYTRIFLKSLERKAALVEGDSVKAQRTYNGDIVEGVFLGWHYPTLKMQEQGIMAGRVQVSSGKIYDVWPYPIEKLVKKESIELEVIELASEDFVNEPNRYPHEGAFLVKTPNGKLIVKVGHDFEGNSEVSEPIPIC